MIGDRRFEDLEAAAALARLYAAMRLFENLFQPSFKLAVKGAGPKALSPAGYTAKSYWRTRGSTRRGDAA
jgi:hypothetical protein